MILVLYREDGKVLGLWRNARVVGDRVILDDGQEVASGVNAQWAYVPDQDTTKLYKVMPNGAIFLDARYPDDFQLFTVEEQKALFDRETAATINSAMHPFTPIEEQIGIIREQIVQILNALGIAPTPEFAKLNEVAIQAIEEGRKLKEGLYAKNNSTS